MLAILPIKLAVNPPLKGYSLVVIMYYIGMLVNYEINI